MLLEKKSFSTDAQLNSLLKQAKNIAKFVLKDNDKKIDNIKEVKIVEDKSYSKIPKKLSIKNCEYKGIRAKASDLF